MCIMCRPTRTKRDVPRRRPPTTKSNARGRAVEHSSRRSASSMRSCWLSLARAPNRSSTPLTAMRRTTSRVIKDQVFNEKNGLIFLHFLPWIFMVFPKTEPNYGGLYIDCTFLHGKLIETCTSVRRHLIPVMLGSHVTLVQVVVQANLCPRPQDRLACFPKV